MAIKQLLLLIYYTKCVLFCICVAACAPDNFSTFHSHSDAGVISISEKHTAKSICHDITCPTHTHTHNYLTILCLGLSRWAGTRKVKPIWILPKQETMSGRGISWAICKSAPLSRPITMPAPDLSVLYRLDALPAAQPTALKHWRQHNDKINLLVYQQCLFE